MDQTKSVQIDQIICMVKFTKLNISSKYTSEAKGYPKHCHWHLHSPAFIEIDKKTVIDNFIISGSMKISSICGSDLRQ